MNGNPKEVRFTGQMRASGTEKKPTLSGYAIVYNSMSLDLGGFQEIIKPGAFTRCLQTNPDIFCITNHDSTKILGRTSAGTLRLKDDSRGLGFSLDVPDTTLGRDTYESVKRGDIRGCSFALGVVDEDWDKGTGALPIRTVNDADILGEITITAYPAYPGTQVDARSLWPTGKPEHLEVRNLARTVKNHTRAAIEEAALRAENRRKLDAIADDDRQAQERIEAERRRIALL